MTLISDVMHDIKMVHPDSYNFLKKYLSPISEVSLFKGIPITQESFENIEVLKCFFPYIRIRYRGPRPEVSALGQKRHTFNRQSYCLKCDATSIAIYERGYKYISVAKRRQPFHTISR